MPSKMSKKPKDIAFNNSNLYLYGGGHDTNGNHVVKVGFPNRNGFSIQTVGVLPVSNRLVRKNTWHQLSESELDQVEAEVVAYVKEFGSKDQKATLKTYDTFAKGGEIPKTENKMSPEDKELVRKLEAAIKSSTTPEKNKPALQAKLDAIRAKESESKKAAEPKEPAKKKSNKGGSSAGAKAGAERMALAGEIHKREKKNGMTWPQAMKAASNQLKGIVEKPKPKVKKLVRAAKPVKKAVKKLVRKAKPAPAKKSTKKLVRLRGSSDKAIDKSIKAKKPGKRLSRAGNTYYETRRNRADNDLRKKL